MVGTEEVGREEEVVRWWCGGVAEPGGERVAWWGWRPRGGVFNGLPARLEHTSMGCKVSVE